MPGLHRVSGTLIPLQRGAGVVGNRPFATHIEQTIAFACACVIKAFDELAMLEEFLPVAFIMNGLAIEHCGTQVGVKFWGFLVEYPVDQSACNHFSDRWATGHVDYFFGCISTTEAFQCRFD